MLTALDRNERAGLAPERVADVVVRAIEAGRPRPRYAVGSNAPLVFALRRVLPAAFAEKMVHRRHDLTR
jgi:hypothetical protein